MAAFLLRRASSSLLPLAIRSPVSSSSSLIPLSGSSFFASRFPPFSTSSINRPFLKTTHESSPGQLITDPRNESVTLRRKTEDEIIEILVMAAAKDINDRHVPDLLFHVRILYGNNLNRGFEAFCHASHDYQFVVDEISILYEKKSGVTENVGRNHLDEFEDFFKKRGVESCNFNFCSTTYRKEMRL